jgi:hypothetical protein
MAQSIPVGGTLRKQPAEILTIAFAYTGKLPTGATLATGQVLVSDTHRPLLATIASSVIAAGATTLLLQAHPGVGARLLIQPGQSTQEIVRVLTVTGGGPYTATITPALAYGHASGSPMQYELGVAESLVQSITANIAGEEARLILRNGVHGHTYRVTVLATLSTGDVLEDECFVEVYDR